MSKIKKQLIIFNQYFHPAIKAGGPVKSLNLLYKKLKDKIIIKVFTSNRDIDGSKIKLKNKDFIVCKSYYDLIKKCLILLINLKKGTIINFNSFFSFNFTIIPLFLIKLFFLNKFSIVISARGELFEDTIKSKFLKKKLYIYFFKLFLSKNIIFHSTSNNEYKSIKKIFSNNNVHNIPNLVENKNFKTSQKNYNKKIPKFIFYSRIVKKKKLDRAIKILSEINRKLILDIYGPIEDQVYWSKIKQQINSNKNSKITISYKGIIKDNVQKTIKNYNFFIFLSSSENFGHVVIEAMQGGCIPILSKNLPWKTIEKKKCGIILENNDQTAQKKLNNFLKNLNNKIYLKYLNNLKNFNKKIIKSNNSKLYFDFYKKL